MKIYDIETLQKYISNGKKVKYLYFWGDKKIGKSITKASLSQWYDSPFEHNGILYLTAEHFMMAQKAKLFGDKQTLKKILDSTTPALAKKFGREVKGFREEVWEKKRFEIVVAGNMLKFQEPKLKAFLLNTSGRVLVEASPVDKIWGVGLAEDDKNIHNPFNWRGLNLLGFALMRVREQILQEEFEKLS